MSNKLFEIWIYGLNYSLACRITAPTRQVELL